jgi:gluconate 5-dehydrogenase
MAISIFDLSGKCALITGGSQGIGLAIAKGLAEAGALVVINGRNPDKLNQCVELLKKDSIHAETSLFDVTDEEQIQSAIAGIESTLQPIDILVNNAGIIRRSAAEDVEITDWHMVLQTNLTAPFVMSKYIGQRMIQRQRGKIINVCSLMIELGRDSVVAYAAAKGGLKMLTRNLATEWAPHNIQVNGIGQGYIATPINTNYREAGNPLNDYSMGYNADQIPSGRGLVLFYFLAPQISS